MISLLLQQVNGCPYRTHEWNTTPRITVFREKSHIITAMASLRQGTVHNKISEQQTTKRDRQYNDDKEMSWFLRILTQVQKRYSQGRRSLRLTLLIFAHIPQKYIYILESRRRRTKGSVVGEEWCQNAAPLRWYTKNVFAQSKMILSRAWLHDTVSCAAWNDARKGVYLKPFLRPLAATVIEAEANQLCWTTGTSPSWKVCL